MARGGHHIEVFHEKPKKWNDSCDQELLRDREANFPQFVALRVLAAPVLFIVVGTERMKLSYKTMMLQ